MGRRLLTRWESLSGRNRVLLAIPIAFVVLFAFHEAFFPLLSWSQSLTYAVMECVPVALVIAWATENELRRRADAAEARAGHATPDDDTP
ncbi:MAG: hypothetical protein JWM86_2156 [Thermoleophilia bacterium]|nr:hypothetical protein [Thermoleophilia bacterium]